VKNMEKELGDGNRYSGILTKLAQYELTLKDWMEQPSKLNLGLYLVM